jgi:ABC-type antimicrobial peptide transport system permease subunit
MRSFLSIIGIILIVLGVVGLGYQGFTYTKQEKVAQIGDVKLTADKEKTISIPPLMGGASLVAGIVLVLIARRGGTPN